jgi:hypothetical protein
MHSALRAVAVAAALVIVALLTFIPPSTDDFWLHAAIGRIIWAGGEIPRTALFPFTEAAAFPFHAHEWLASVALHLLNEGLGRDRLVLANGALGLILFGLAWRLSFRLTAGFIASLLVALAVMATVNYRHYLRPELFALIFTLIVLGLLVEYRSGRRWRHLLACTPVALLWANSHGSFPLALLLAASFAALAAIEAPADRLRATAPYLACCALMGLAMLVNPYGIHVFRFAGGEPGGFWAFAAVVGVYPLSAALRPFAARLDRSLAAHGALVAILAACAALLVRYGNVYGGYPYFVKSHHFSPALIDYVEARKFEGNVLNSPALGAELVYRFYPRLRPSIDSRIDVYGQEYFERLLTAQNDEQVLRQFVERYRVRYILMLWPEFEQSMRRMPRLQDDGWRIVFADHKMVMLERP